MQYMDDLFHHLEVAYLSLGEGHHPLLVSCHELDHVGWRNSLLLGRLALPGRPRNMN